MMKMRKANPRSSITTPNSYVELRDEELTQVGGGCCDDILKWFWNLFEDNTTYVVDSDTAVA